MISIPTVIERRIQHALPTRTAWVESWGFILLGFGIFLALSCYSFNPYDYSVRGVLTRGITNLGGPIGAKAAAHVLGRFGVIGMIWPAALTIWGAFTVTGFVLVPRPRRVLGFIAIAAVLSGFAQVLLPYAGFAEPTFHYGGMIGMKFYKMMMPKLGLGGTLTALAVLFFNALVLTGNLEVSRTASVTYELWFLVKRMVRRNIRRLTHPKSQVKAPAQIVVKGNQKREQEGLSKEEIKQAEIAQKDAQDIKVQSGLEFYYDGPAHGRPDPSIFSRSQAVETSGEDYSAITATLVEQLAEFKIFGDITSVTRGPLVTTFEFKPAPGTKVSKISALGEDLARLLKAQSLRVIAPIPGKDTVGFEVPNLKRATIGFADLLMAPDFRSGKAKLPIAMGSDIFGKPVIQDLAEMPHLLVAGSTGSGKSVFMNTLVGSLIARHSASTLRFVMIDPKMVELAAYNSLPHMACPVITDPAGEALSVLNGLVNEMENRYRNMRIVGARNIDSFNEIVKTRKRSEFVDFEGRFAPMPYIVLIIDEMADMMMNLGKEAEAPIARLAQKARAAGIHMVIATQRPSADVVTGLIKANFPTRVAFRVLSGIDSRTILDQTGAEGLLGRGDMLYLSASGANRLHGAFLSETEVQTMVSKAKARKK